MIDVPFARAINPIFKTNWEGTGVEPDVKEIPRLRAIPVHSASHYSASISVNSVPGLPRPVGVLKSPLFSWAGRKEPQATGI